MADEKTSTAPPSKGVKYTTPPASIIADALAMVNQGMAQLEPHDRGAIVTIVTPKGINGAIVSRMGDHMELVGWIGASWGEKVTGGGAVKIRW